MRIRPFAPILGLFLVFMLSFGALTSSVAQDAGKLESATIVDRINASLAPAAKRIREIEKSLASDDPDEGKLTGYRNELEEINAGILEQLVGFQPDILELETRIGRLPPPPADGQPPEPEDVASERKRLADLKTKTTIAIKDAELLAVRSGGLLNRVLEARRAQFVTALLKRRSLDVPTFRTVVDDAPGRVGEFWNTISTWVATNVRFNLAELLAVLGLTGLLAGLLYRLLRPLRRWVEGVDEAGEVPPLQRIIMAFFNTVLPGAVILMGLLGFHLLLGLFGLYRLRVDLIIPSFLFMLSGLAFVWLLLNAILAPARPKRRLITMTDGAASRLFWLGFLMAAIYGIDYFISRLITIFSVSVSFTIVKSLIATLVIAAGLVAVVMTRLNVPDETEPRSGYRGWNRFIYWFVWLSIIAIVMAEISGYVSLGRFMAGQIIITGSILATMYIGFLASRAIAAQGAVSTTRLGAHLRNRSGTSDLKLDQLGLMLSILINAIVVLIGLPILMLQWGFKIDEIMGWASSALTGFTIGGVQISIGRLLFALLAFVLLIMATRVVQRWFDGKVLARTQLDSGVKNSVKAGVGYLGFFLAALVGISWAGFNLSNIALIAGALSVGIGFGLQNIVNNFVSGIIMLIERPIKVGDIIAVAGSEGFVRKINVRATELETFDRQSVIIPNSEVINTSVGNWMHTDSVRRIVIGVGVAYGSDIEKVRELLLDCLKDDERVATFPAPFVYFADFGSSSLDFQLRFFIRDIMDTVVVETDVRFAIDKTFNRHGIEIPFPQTDLHIRSGLPKTKSG